MITRKYGKLNTKINKRVTNASRGRNDEKKRDAQTFRPVRETEIIVVENAIYIALL